MFEEMETIQHVLSIRFVICYFKRRKEKTHREKPISIRKCSIPATLSPRINMLNVFVSFAFLMKRIFIVQLQYDDFDYTIISYAHSRELEILLDADDDIIEFQMKSSTVWLSEIERRQKRHFLLAELNCLRWLAWRHSLDEKLKIVFMLCDHHKRWLLFQLLFALNFGHSDCEWKTVDTDVSANNTPEIQSC